MSAYKDDFTDALYELMRQNYTDEDIREIVERCLKQRDLLEDEDDEEPAIDESYSDGKDFDDNTPEHSGYGGNYDPYIPF